MFSPLHLSSSLFSLSIDEKDDGEKTIIFFVLLLFFYVSENLSCKFERQTYFNLHSSMKINVEIQVYTQILRMKSLMQVTVITWKKIFIVRQDLVSRQSL